MPSCFSWNLTGVRPFPLTLTWLSQLTRGTCSACLPWASRLLLSEDPERGPTEFPHCFCPFILSRTSFPCLSWRVQPLPHQQQKRFAPGKHSTFVLFGRKYLKKQGYQYKAPGDRGAPEQHVFLPQGHLSGVLGGGTLEEYLDIAIHVVFGNNFSFDTFYHKCGPIIEKEPLFP